MAGSKIGGAEPERPRRNRRPLLQLRHILPILLFIPIFAVLIGGLDRDPSLVPSPLIGKLAPEFSLPRLGETGTEPVGPADLHGQVWVLNVWASWCVACIAEHPLLSDITGVTLVGLNYKDLDGDALRWLAERGDPYTFSLVDRSGRAGLDWGVYGVPETFVIDAEGVIRLKHIGPLDSRSVAEELMPLVRELQAEAGQAG